VKPAVLHEDLEHLARLVLEKAVVGQDHCGPAAALEDVRHVLDEVELLVAGLDGEVVAHGRLVGPLRAEGRVGQDAVVQFVAVGLVDGIAEVDRRLQAVQEKIHQREAPGARHEVLAVVRGRADPLEVLPLDPALLQQPLVGAHEKASRPAGRVADREVPARPRVGFHDADDGLDQNPRREVLARALLALAGRLFEQALEGRPLHVHVHGGPFFLVDHGDEALQIDGVVESGHGLAEDIAEKALGLPKPTENVLVVIRQFRAGLCLQAVPAAALRDLDAALVGHLQEEQVSELLDVVAVIDPVVAQGVAEPPELVDDVGHGRGVSFLEVLSEVRDFLL